VLLLGSYPFSISGFSLAFEGKFLKNPKKFKNQKFEKEIKMANFHLPQFEHEAFWQYSSRLNNYCAQYVHFTYAKWKICNVMLEGITHEILAPLESMCYGGMSSLDVDDVCDLFKSLLCINGTSTMLAGLLCAILPFPMICMLNLHV